ncbi:MAG TPA: membrane protein insertase YidC, partial [Candidatus Binataceae bacterium]|nr:membrane protein insertase YidC [Candidatus Binataceae bacterium]
MENNRLIIAVLVAMGVLFGYQEFLQWRYPDLYGPKAKHAAPVVAPPAASGAGASSSGQESSAQATPGLAAAEGSPAAGGAGAITPFAEHLVVIDTDLYEATLTSHGARLESFKLKKYRATAAPQSPDYELIRRGERMPIGMVVVQNGVSRDDADVDYATTAPARIEATGDAPVKVTFTATTHDGSKLEKTFSFRGSSYVFDVAAQAALASGAAPGGLGLTLSQPLTALAGYRDNPEIQADVQGKIETGVEKTVQKGMAPVSGQISFAGFGDRYFLAAFLPITPQTGTFTVTYANGEADAQILFTGVGHLASRVFMGPKELNLLEAVDPTLSKAIDLGYWGIIALPFLRLLKLFYRVFPNYGVAIILLTIVVKLATLPIAVRGQRSMMKMQRLQPQVTKIREKYKDDSERLNREMVDLYKRNHVNPLGGCLPMLIQFPVMIALYQTLLNAVDLRHAAFIGW